MNTAESKSTGFFHGRRVVVTGGAGFLGRYVVEGLRRRGCCDIFVPRSAGYDLAREADVARLYADSRPDVVIHLAAVVGGIGANLANPGRYFYDNLAMGILLMEHGRRCGVEKFTAVGTVCAYPKFCRLPFREDSLWDGYPEETNAPYGLAKKMLLVQAQAYREQYGFNAIYLLPANLYGPGDDFDPLTSHVIPAVIKKCADAVDAGRPTITIWGDGSASREFLFAADAAEGILLATERYNEGAPVNLGTGREVTIRELVALIAGLTGFGGAVEWNASMPGGQPRRCLDISRAREKFAFVAATGLEEGLRQTVDWYLASRRGN